MDLIEKLENWHRKNQFQKIVDAVRALPAGERTVELKGRMASALNNLEDYQGALDILEAEDHDGDARWVYRKAYAYYYLDREEEAEACFRLAGELDPEDADAPYYLIQIYLYHVDKPEALDAAAAKLKALSPEAYHELSDLPQFASYLAIKDLAGRDNLDYEQTMRLSKALYDLNRYPQALSTLDGAAPEGAEDQVYHYARGLILLHLERKAEAESALLRCLALHPAARGPWYILAGLYKDDPAKIAEYREAAARVAAFEAEEEQEGEGGETGPKSFQEAWEEMVNGLARTTSPAQWNELHYWEQEMLSLNSLVTAVFVRGFGKFFEESGDRVYPYAMKAFAAIHNDENIPGSPNFGGEENRPLLGGEENRPHAFEEDEIDEKAPEAWQAFCTCWQALGDAYELFTEGQGCEAQDELFRGNHWGFVYAAFVHYRPRVLQKAREDAQS